MDFYEKNAELWKIADDLHSAIMALNAMDTYAGFDIALQSPGYAYGDVRRAWETVMDIILETEIRRPVISLEEFGVMCMDNHGCYKPSEVYINFLKGRFPEIERYIIERRDA